VAHDFAPLTPPPNGRVTAAASGATAGDGHGGTGFVGLGEVAMASNSPAELHGQGAAYVVISGESIGNKSDYSMLHGAGSAGNFVPAVPAPSEQVGLSVQTVAALPFDPMTKPRIDVTDPQQRALSAMLPEKIEVESKPSALSDLRSRLETAEATILAAAVNQPFKVVPETVSAKTAIEAVNTSRDQKADLSAKPESGFVADRFSKPGASPDRPAQSGQPLLAEVPTASVGQGAITSKGSSVAATFPEQDITRKQSNEAVLARSEARTPDGSAVSSLSKSPVIGRADSIQASEPGLGVTPLTSQNMPPGAIAIGSSGAVNLDRALSQAKTDAMVAAQSVTGKAPEDTAAGFRVTADQAIRHSSTTGEILTGTNRITPELGLKANRTLFAQEDKGTDAQIKFQLTQGKVDGPSGTMIPDGQGKIRASLEVSQKPDPEKIFNNDSNIGGAKAAPIVSTEPNRSETASRPVEIAWSSTVDISAGANKAIKNETSKTSIENLTGRHGKGNKGQNTEDIPSQDLAGATKVVSPGVPPLGTMQPQSLPITGQTGTTQINGGSTDPGAVPASAPNGQQNANGNAGTLTTAFVLAGGTLPDLQIFTSVQSDVKTSVPTDSTTPQGPIIESTKHSDPGIPAGSLADPAGQTLTRVDNAESISGAAPTILRWSEPPPLLVADTIVPRQDWAAPLSDALGLAPSLRTEDATSDSPAGELTGMQATSTETKWQLPDALGMVGAETEPLAAAVSDTTEDINSELIALASDLKNTKVKALPNDRAIQNFMVEIIDRAKRKNFKIDRETTFADLAQRLFDDTRIAGLLLLLNPQLISEGQDPGNLKLSPGTILKLPNVEEVLSYKVQVLGDQLPFILHEEFSRSAGDKSNERSNKVREQYRCRLGDSLISIAKRHHRLRDEALWPLLARVNNLATGVSHDRLAKARLERGSIIVIPSRKEVDEYHKEQISAFEQTQNEEQFQDETICNLDGTLESGGNIESRLVRTKAVELFAHFNFPTQLAMPDTVRIIAEELNGDKEKCLVVKLEMCVTNNWLPVIEYRLEPQRCQLRSYKSNGEFTVTPIQLPDQSLRQLIEFDLSTNFANYCEKFVSDREAS
jgi:hypothetical protein